MVAVAAPKTCKREREGGRERDRQTDRLTDRERERESREREKEEWRKKEVRRENKKRHWWCTQGFKGCMAYPGPHPLELFRGTVTNYKDRPRKARKLKFYWKICDKFFKAPLTSFKNLKGPIFTSGPLTSFCERSLSVHELKSEKIFHPRA